MTMKTFKVDTETLVLIDQYLKAHPNGQQNISEAIIKSITTLNEADSGKHQMLTESSLELVVTPKKEFSTVVKKKYGKKGPYKVSRTVKSFAQVTDGFYTLDGSESLYPTEWFEIIPEKAEEIPSRLSNHLTAIIWGIVFLAMGYTVGIMHFMYILMLV